MVLRIFLSYVRGLVAESELSGHSIGCQRHSALFDVRAGSALSMPAVAPIVKCKARIEGEDIVVESPASW